MPPSDNIDKLRELVEEAAQIESEYSNFFNLSVELFAIATKEGYFRKVNPMWIKVTGFSEDELLSRPILSFVHPDDCEHTEQVLGKLSEEGASTNGFENRYIAKDGSVVRLEWSSITVGDDIYAVAKDITDTKRIETALKLLARAGIILSEDYKYDDTLQRICDIFVPEFADWSAIDIASSNGDLERRAVAHQDPEVKKRVLEEVSKLKTQNREEGAYKVLQTGVPQLVPSITRDFLREYKVAEEIENFVLKLNMHSVIIVPLNAWGKKIGTLTLVSTDSLHQYSNEDLNVAVDIGKRCGIAIYNAMTFNEVGRISSGAKRYSHILRNVEEYLDESIENITLSRDRIMEVRRQVTEDDAR